VLAPQPEEAVPLMVGRAPLRGRPLLMLSVVERTIEAEYRQRVLGLQPHARGEAAPPELAAIDGEDAVAHCR
jgi:hypothetical protein